MGTAIGSALTQAVGIAISPLPIVLVILMLVSRRARVNGLAFVAGWVVATLGVSTIAFALADAAAAGTPTSDGAEGANALQVVLGLAFLALAVRQFLNRPAAGEAPTTPKLFDAVDSMGGAKAFLLGGAGCLANPKNLPLAISAGTAVAVTGAAGGTAAGALVVFVLVASATVIVPVVVYFALGERSVRLLDSWKAWLVANNATIMTVLFTVLGANLLADGLALFS